VKSKIDVRSERKKLVGHNPDSQMKNKHQGIN
jgi:hypothetical protein